MRGDEADPAKEMQANWGVVSELLGRVVPVFVAGGAQREAASVP